MSDLISRQAAIDAVGSMLRRKFGIGGDLAEVTLAELPSAQPTQSNTESNAESTQNLISRADALSCFHDWIDSRGDVHTADEMPEFQRIEQLPSAQSDASENTCDFERKSNDMISIQQPKTGKWVYGSPVTVKCNQCGFYIPDWEAHSSRFCRNCGCRMLKEGEEHESC